MAHIEFTDNYEDLSTDSGYQFKFICESCGNGYMSSWKASKTGMASGLLRGAGSMLGGFLGSASAGADHLQDLVGGPAHDNALKDAVAEIRPLFVQCKRCGQWVCREVCWNAERGLCTSCAPDRAAGGQLHAGADHRGTGRRETARAGPHRRAQPHRQSGGDLSRLRSRERGGQVLPECGGSLRPSTECPRCGTKFKAGAKFCPECGAKTN